MNKDAKLADYYYHQCLVSGDLIPITVNVDSEAAFIKLLSAENKRYYLSGSQLMGGQRVIGKYSLEKTDYEIIKKHHSAFNEIVSVLQHMAVP